MVFFNVTTRDNPAEPANQGLKVSQKEILPYFLNWQSSTPVPFVPNTAPSGVTSGTMSSTNTIYTNIIDVSRYDNLGIEIAWTGTPTGTISVMGSNSGSTFSAITFNPALTQPAGSAGGYLVNLQQFPFRYFMLQYVNASGSGTLTAYLMAKDLN